LFPKIFKTLAEEKNVEVLFQIVLSLS